MHRNRPLNVHDPVFATITFNDDEVKIIDSPLLQRLKGVAQMGLTRTTYPGADHTRFSHSLGMSHIAGRVFREIRPDVASTKPEQKAYSALRIASLLHDCCQGPFSHVSDRVANIFFQLTEYGEARQNPTVVPNMHELVAFDVLTCPKMQEHLKKILDLDVDWIQKIPYAIVGAIVNRRSVHEYLVTALVNGIFDCDKLDYIIRDSLYSGLPLPLDTERLVRMVKIVDVSGDPHFAIEQRGARSLDLLYRGRAFLYPTVYQHHTVRAFESMIIIGLLHTMKEKVDAPSRLRRIAHPLDLLFHDDSTIFNYFRMSDSAFLNDIGNRVLTRRHPRVAVEFTTRDLKYLSEKRLGNRSSLLALYEIAKNPAVRHGFQQEVLKSCGKAAPEGLVKEIPSIAKVSAEHMLDFALPIDVLEAPGRKVYTDKYVESCGFFDRGLLVSLNDLEMPDPLQAAKGVSGVYGFRFYALPELESAVSAPLVGLLKKRLAL